MFPPGNDSPLTAKLRAGLDKNMPTDTTYSCYPKLKRTCNIHTSMHLHHYHFSALATHHEFSAPYCLRRASLTQRRRIHLCQCPADTQPEFSEVTIGPNKQAELPSHAINKSYPPRRICSAYRSSLTLRGASNASSEKARSGRHRRELSSGTPRFTRRSLEQFKQLDRYRKQLHRRRSRVPRTDFGQSSPEARPPSPDDHCTGRNRRPDDRP